MCSQRLRRPLDNLKASTHSGTHNVVTLECSSHTRPSGSTVAVIVISTRGLTCPLAFQGLRSIGNDFAARISREVMYGLKNTALAHGVRLQLPEYKSKLGAATLGPPSGAGQTQLLMAK
eukprot:scaffold931_cov383-Prasinococcus_capsulatus_cf.AAC.11